MVNYKGNLGLLFNKYYFRDNEMKLDKELLKNENVNLEKIIKKNDDIIKYKMESKKVNRDEPWNIKLKFKTIYPGLIIGSGLEHGIGIEGEFKQGFYFDYTTGLPIISGSSIKGVLRSVFPFDEKDPLKEGKIKYINNLLDKEYDLNDIRKIRDIIFEGVDNINKDVFFDAEIISDINKSILDEDFITPHRDALKNPIPIKFIKVKPNIEFEFKFKLFDSEMLKKEEKIRFFKDVLLDIGVGAKTNLGYGQFSRNYTDLFFSKYIDELKKEEDEKKKIEFNKLLESLVGFEKVKLLYYSKKMNNKEREDELRNILEKIEEYDNNIQVAEFLKTEYDKLDKWNGKQSKKQKKKIKKINEIINKG